MSKPTKQPENGERARILAYVPAPVKRKLRLDAARLEISFQAHVRQILEAAVNGGGKG